MSTTTRAMDDRARFWSLAAVITHMLFIGLTLGISFPLTSLILEARDAPGWQIGLAGSMPALGILIIMPLAPRLVGRIGAIPAMCLGCVIGSGIGGIETVETQTQRLFNLGPRKVSPFMIPSLIANIASGVVPNASFA